MTLPERNRDLSLDRQGAEGAAATTYLNTFVCYGAWLPGQVGAVPCIQNAFGARLPEPDGGREQRARNEMTQEPYVLDVRRRDVVLRSLQEVCSRRGWTLLAAHVRTNHMHVVATAACKPEPMLNALKAYSSRALTHLALDSPNRRRWARHGSTRYLWTSAAVSAAFNTSFANREISWPCSRCPPLADARGSVAFPNLPQVETSRLKIQLQRQL
jgi:REP element-mobilizing transposase RayT